MSARRLIVHGRVQGVGFRWFTRLQGRSLDLTGWVRNRGDGTVEIWAEGPDKSLADLADAVSQGPPGSRVTSVENLPAQPTGRYFSFDVTY